MVYCERKGGELPPPLPLRKELTSMKFTFTDKKVNIPNRVHTYAEKKIGKLDRYFQTEPEASIVFSVEKGRNNLEVTIRSGATVIRVAESTSDMFVSIDAAVASIERQLRKNKSRLEKRLRKGLLTSPTMPSSSPTWTQTRSPATSWCAPSASSSVP